MECPQWAISVSSAPSTCSAAPGAGIPGRRLVFIPTSSTWLRLACINYSISAVTDPTDETVTHRPNVTPCISCNLDMFFSHVHDSCLHFCS